MKFITICEYHFCKSQAKTTWAQIPVCLHHHELIRDETQQYYAGRITAEQREHLRKLHQGARHRA